MYKAMACRQFSLRRMAVKAFEHTFEILDEARALMHCRSLPGVVRLAGVSLITDPCRRVSGHLFDYYPRGNLVNVLM